MKRLLAIAPLAVLLFASCVAPLIYVVGSVEEAACVRNLPRGTVDPSDGGELYACTETGGAHFHLIAFKAPGGEIDIPGDETRENALCSFKPSPQAEGACFYECDWPEGWVSTAQSDVACPDAGR